MILRRTLASGTALGVALLTALTLAGIMSARSTPQPVTPAPSPQPGTLSGSQPELRSALIQPADLPEPYVAASKATVRRLPQTEERCAILLDPKMLVREASARVLPHPEATDQASAQLEGRTQLTQLLTTFAADGAEATLHELRLMGRQCRDFDAQLDDGRPVRVNSSVVRDDGDIYSVRLTLTGAGRTTSGYLTLGRVGQVLSVLRELGPAEALDPIRLVDLTLSRLTQTR